MTLNLGGLFRVGLAVLVKSWNSTSRDPSPCLITPWSDERTKSNVRVRLLLLFAAVRETAAQKVSLWTETMAEGQALLSSISYVLVIARFDDVIKRCRLYPDP